MAKIQTRYFIEPIGLEKYSREIPPRLVSEALALNLKFPNEWLEDRRCDGIQIVRCSTVDGNGGSTSEKHVVQRILFGTYSGMVSHSTLTFMDRSGARCVSQKGDIVIPIE